MPDYPAVSVVMPTKNRAHLLSSAIQNCLEQTWTDLELVVVNDGSTDHTATILERYQNDERVQVIHCRRSVGLPRALNVGFGATRGEFLSWTSDDNAFHPHALERMVHALQSQPQAGLVYADMFRVSPDGHRELARRSEPPYMIEENCVGACFLYRREVMRRIGHYAPEFALAEDYDFFLRVYLAGIPMIHLQEPLYDYAVHDQAYGATEGHDRVRLQTANVLRKRLPAWRREWLRLRRRAAIVWRRYAVPT